MTAARATLPAVIISLLLTACGVGSLPSSSPAPPTAASATPFQMASPTATPAPLGVWLSPALPPLLRDEALALLDGHGGFVQAQQQESADVRLEAGALRPLSRWTYALVAPFPTVPEGVARDELVAAWSGSGPAQVLAAPETAAALASHLGAVGASTPMNAADLLDETWSGEDRWAVVPFEQLEPRWKVLRVQGQSPLEREFDPAAYTLSVPFGASGDPAAVERLAAALDWPATNRDPDKMTIVAVTGVSALTRATAWAIERNGIGWAVEAVQPWFDGADVVHVSHEVSFATDCPPVNPSRDVMRFCGQPVQIEVFERIGTDVVELTGNHVMDWGPEAFLYSLDEYRARDWSTYGGGENLAAAWQPALVEHNGHRLAFLGCNSAGPGFAWATAEGPGATPCDMERLHAEIGRLRAEGYLPIVTFQWAESYRRWPLPPQAEAFRAAARAGALIVSGSQAHQAQGFEFLDDSFIHYGPGNLFFDQMWSLETRQEFVVRYVLYEGRHLSTDLRTALLEEYARPRPMSEAERSEFLNEIFSASGW